MGFSDQQFRTIKCDGPECEKTVTFDLKDTKTIQETEWLKGVRVIQTGDGRSFAYCSDVCEVKGVTTGNHNLKEKPAVQPATTGDIKAAAAAAEAAKKAEAAVRNGEPAQVTLD